MPVNLETPHSFWYKVTSSAQRCSFNARFIRCSIKMLPIPRVLPLLEFPCSIRPILAARFYATQTGLGASNAQPTRKRKAVTMLNDDGRVAWGDLSAKEKAARTTQQTFNFGMILIGIVLTVCSLSSISSIRADIWLGWCGIFYVYGCIFAR
jgi:hypothetical protein